MNFQLAAQGRSFKGAMAYYLHDKRQDEAEAHPASFDRVAWTETRNLATDGAHTATRIMIATAKEAAAQKAGQTGRKDVKPVLGFSLAWHPSEAATLTRAEMVRAADEALKVAKLDHLQAVIIAHRDTAHPHVHIVLNRVDPDTGKLTPTPPSMARALDKWAHDYEQERGLIVSPNRADKYRRQEDARQKHPDPDKRRDYVDGAKAKAAAEAEARREAVAQAKVSSLPEARAAVASTKPPSEAATLKALTDAQKARHKSEWPALAEKNKAERAGIYEKFSAIIKAMAAQHKQDTRADWREFFKEQRGELRQAAKMEKSVAGLISLSLACAKEQMRRGEAPNRGLLSLTFANVLSSHRRAATLAAVQERDKVAFANRLKGQLDQKIEAVKHDRAAALAAQRKAFEADRSKLIDQQNTERAKIREAWRQIYARRGQTPTQSAQAAPRMEFFAVKGEFEQKARGMPFAPKTPSEPRFVAKASPAPSPMGAPPVPAKTLQDVPKAEPKMPSVTTTPQPSRAWSQVADTSPKPSPSKAWDKAADTPREIKPLSPRSKDRDRER